MGRARPGGSRCVGNTGISLVEAPMPTSCKSTSRTSDTVSNTSSLTVYRYTKLNILNALLATIRSCWLSEELHWQLSLSPSALLGSLTALFFCIWRPKFLSLSYAILGWPQYRRRGGRFQQIGIDL